MLIEEISASDGKQRSHCNELCDARNLARALLGYAYLIRGSLAQLGASGRGSIINVASAHAVNPRAGMGQCDVTK